MEPHMLGLIIAYSLVGAFFAMCSDQALCEAPEIYAVVGFTPVTRIAIATITALTWPILVLAWSLR
jgi:hypothetical protein